jgi:hypothetical protein
VVIIAVALVVVAVVDVILLVAVEESGVHAGPSAVAS